MIDIDLYENFADKYEEIQEKRPDYALAQKALRDFIEPFLKYKREIHIADFCCGTGRNSLLISQRFSVSKVTLIDTNKEFLDKAMSSGIRSLEIVPLQLDILDADLKSENDLVISMFAYHHVRDEDKARYIEIAKTALKKRGVLFLGEIYLPDKKTTLIYYKKLLEAIPVSLRTPELENFLRQTAESDAFEYKVSRKFAHDQLTAAGFRLQDGVKIWPKENDLGCDVGMFVEVWELVGI